MGWPWACVHIRCPVQLYLMLIDKIRCLNSKESSSPYGVESLSLQLFFSTINKGKY